MRNHSYRALLGRSLAVAAATLGLIAATVAGPATAAGEYVALGDSYAAGQGAPPYSDPVCLVSSTHSYPVLVAAARGVTLVDNAACSGDTAAGVLASQLGALSARTTLVTVTVGANDVGTAALVGACYPNSGTPACLAALNNYSTALRQLNVSIPRLKNAIRAAAPNAQIIATGYPKLFESGIDPFFDRANGLTGALNAALAGNWLASGAQFANVDPAFAGHRIGSAVPWINFDPSNFSIPENFHPNAAGYAAYARVVSAVRTPVFAY